MSGDAADRIIAEARVDGRDYDGDGNLVHDRADPLAPIKEAVKAAPDEDLIPGRVYAAVEAMARFGMDDSTRVTVRAYLGRNRKLGVGLAEFDSTVDRARRARKRVLANTSSPSLPPAEDAHLHTPPKWAAEQDILARAVRTLRVCMRLVGENRNAKLVYLALTSRLLDKQVNIVVKGLSASGKSYTIQCVAVLFPPEAVYTMTAMSERALIYLDEPLSYRTIILYEAAALREGREKLEDNQTAYIVRSLLSEGRIEYPVVIRQDDGTLRTEKIIVPGPTNLVTSTTSISLHPENETRMISLASNDSKEQTRAVLISASDDDEPPSPPDVDDWHEYQRWLAGANRKVTIPYATCIAAQVPPDAVRLRRDWNTVRALIRAHAMMHQLNRETDDRGYVIATLGDYAAVRSLVGELVAEGIGATVPPTVRQTVETVRRIVTEQAEHSRDAGHLGDWDGASRGATVAAVAAKLGIERPSASRRLATAREKGYLVSATASGKASLYTIGEAMPGETAVLPDRTAVCTGTCSHLSRSEGAGQDCDCTGVCRCADNAEGIAGGDIGAEPSAGDATYPSPLPPATDAHLHTPPEHPRVARVAAPTVTGVALLERELGAQPIDTPAGHRCDACGAPGTRYLSGITLCGSCKDQRDSAQRAQRLADGDLSACRLCGAVTVLVDGELRCTRTACTAASPAPARCIAPDCPKPARRGCRTCWEHASEYEQPGDADD